MQSRTWERGWHLCSGVTGWMGTWTTGRWSGRPCATHCGLSRWVSATESRAPGLSRWGGTPHPGGHAGGVGVRGCGLGGAQPLPLRLQHAEHCVMVTGVPNVGKSSLINSLRRQHLRKGTSCSWGRGHWFSCWDGPPGPESSAPRGGCWHQEAQLTAWGESAGETGIPFHISHFTRCLSLNV